MNAYLRDVIEGRRRGLAAAALRGALSAASLAYGALHGMHRMAFLMGLARPALLPIPVISVGNLSAGGTGKTPLVEWIVRRLERRRLRVVVLARGYGRRPDGGDDEDLLEPSEFVRRYAEPDRARAARRALAEFRPDVAVLDDGFQHYRLQRDLDLVAVDATHPFGNGRLLPRGLLRDRPSALRTLSDRRTWTVDWLRGRRVYAFCGLGNPGAFRRTVEAAGAEVVKFRAFPDHHVYRSADVRQIEVEAQEFMAGALLTTEKDATKLDASAFRYPLAALRVELEAVRGGDRLEAMIDSAVRSPDPAIAAL